MADTTTTLNPGTGGDKMDETLAKQADGSTEAKRPRAELALADAGLTPRLVGDDFQLPVSTPELGRIADTLDEIRDMLKLALGL